jgi:F-type H+-transporting ATPase subunit b
MEFNATFIISIISFLMFVAIMNKIFYAPITNIVQQREEKIKKDYDAADSLKNEATTILKDRDEKLATAEQKARDIIADKIDDYNSKSKEETALAAEQATQRIQEQKELLNQEKINSERELKSKVIELAQSISSKILGFNVEKDEIEGKIG